MFTSTEVWGSSYLCCTGWSVCAYLWQLIAPTHCLFYLAQKRWHSRYCLSQAGPGGNRPTRHILGVSVCGHSRGVDCISSPGRIGVNEHFNLLAHCQGLLSVIPSPSPGDKYGARGRARCPSDARFGSQETRSQPSLWLAALCHNMSEHQNSLI